MFALADIPNISTKVLPGPQSLIPKFLKKFVQGLFSKLLESYSKKEANFSVILPVFFI